MDIGNIMEKDERVRIEETPEDSVVPVYHMPLTSEEEAHRETLVLEHIENEELTLQKEIAKESALTKLEKLGITQEELSALLG